MKNPKLSIVILSYNTKDLLLNCILSLKKVRKELKFEIIVSDNASSDGSLEMLEEFPWVILIKNKKNLGFAGGNNTARTYIKGEYVLFLNSDTVVLKDTLKEVVRYLDENSTVGALTCKLVLPDGNLDKDARRSFITPWIGLVHVFLKIDRLFPKSRLFGKYWYGYIPSDVTHEVDSLQGAFFLVRKKILDEVGWFDEDYFLDGEDIDLCWRMKEAGWKITYYPKVSITHYKGASKGKVESDRRGEISLKERLKFRVSGVDSMEIFYKKRLMERYPFILNVLVILGIKIIKGTRIVRTLLLG